MENSGIGLIILAFIIGYIGLYSIPKIINEQHKKRQKDEETKKN